MKTKSTFTAIFFTRKSRSNPNQLSIYVRITISGKRAEISLKRSIANKDWDSNKSRGRGSSQKVRTLNAYLDEVYNRLLECHKELLEEDKIISSEAIKARYLGEDDNSKTLRELIAYHHENMAFVLKKGTMKNYYTTERYMALPKSFNIFSTIGSACPQYGH
ncbi:Arm DNA-binding domain-containing protein [Sinomicrobium weinanense]|uniref:Arm DNA-binding domain-containing protein n=1 Tax=Sinomicrobium weinanense TaxID=2842200 RepID=UPI001FFD75A2|nr:Arm DNA-binding domain-containing protein [Sinomicrobium weinanense]